MELTKHNKTSEIGIIYKATNKENGMVYIGQTMQTLENRKAEHIRNAKRELEKFLTGKKKRMNKFYKALTESNFEWEVIDKAITRRRLNDLETKWIAFYESNNPLMGYNSTKGGGGHNNYDRERAFKGIHYTEEGEMYEYYFKNFSEFKKAVNYNSLVFELEPVKECLESIRLHAYGCFWLWVSNEEYENGELKPINPEHLLHWQSMLI